MPHTARRALVVSALAGPLTVLASLTAPAQAATAPVSSFSFTSAQGDYIGGGETKTYTEPGSAFAVSGTAGFLTVSVDGADSWRIDLAAPRGEQLRPGVYRNAERASFRTGRAPGLDVTGRGRGCNEVWGQFTVDQIETAADGSVLVLDASVTQRCESAQAPALTGRVRYRALPLSYRFVSDPGDYIGGGATTSYRNATSVFTLSGTSERVSFGVSGQRDDWSVNLAAPAGQRLAAGSYPNAQRYPFQDPDRPGLSVSGNGRGCNELSGSFTIHDIETRSDGTVLRLHATLEQHCEGAEPALRATIRYYA